MRSVDGWLPPAGSVLSHWVARRGIAWAFTQRQFVAMLAVNLGLVIAYDLLISRPSGSIQIGNTVFFVLMLTLLATLFDRCRLVYLMRFAPSVCNTKATVNWRNAGL